MKLIRRRRPSMNTMLGITQAKRKVAKATGIPTTKAGRKRKALNTITGGAYGKYERIRADVNRPYKTMKRITKPGCLISVLCMLALICGIVGLIILIV